MQKKSFKMTNKLKAVDCLQPEKSLKKRKTDETNMNLGKRSNEWHVRRADWVQLQIRIQVQKEFSLNMNEPGRKLFSVIKYVFAFYV